MNEDQANVWNILLNMFLKLITALSCIAAFWFILLKIINADKALQAWTLTALDSILGGTMFVMVAHYFPAFKATAKKKPAITSKKKTLPSGDTIA